MLFFPLPNATVMLFGNLGISIPSAINLSCFL